MSFITRKSFLAVTLPIALGIITGVYFGGKEYFNRVIYQDISGKSVVLAQGQEMGISDKKSTRDTAIGILLESDDKKKGAHKLARGADALVVYLTSSTVDLDQFIGHGVQVWGETFQRENVGWFMDATKLKVIK